MIQFKDIHGNRWVFVKANITVIYYTPKDQKGIIHVTIATINDNVYSFAVDWNDSNAIKELSNGN